MVHAINLDSADTMLGELWNFLHCNALAGKLESMFFGLTGLKRVCSLPCQQELEVILLICFIFS